MMEFPARCVGEAPSRFWAGPISSYEQAEIERDFLEITHEICCETVKHRDDYYVIVKD